MLQVLSYLFLLWLWILLRSPLLVAGVAGLAALTTVLNPTCKKYDAGHRLYASLFLRRHGHVCRLSTLRYDAAASLAQSGLILRQ